LEDGQGWRSVYVKTRDVFNRTMTVSDTIYVGVDVPLDELGDAQMSTTQPWVTLYGLDGSGLPLVQLSPGWLADDTFGTFTHWWGNGERVNDGAAWGGTAYKLTPGDGESFAWVYDTTFIKDVPLVAYFRLKVNANTSAQEVARVSVKGGGTEYGPLSLHGTDFAAAGVYQEFALPFTFNTNPDDVFLIFQFWRSGTADLYVDAVSIFTPGQPVTSPLTWAVPGGNYRGQGVWARYTDGTQFSPIGEAATFQAGLSVSPASLTFLAVPGGQPPAPRMLAVLQSCGDLDWDVAVDAPWLQAQQVEDAVRVSVDQAGLGTGVYEGTVTVSAAGSPGVPPAEAPVTLIVTDELFPAYLPIILR
jgi:hypothetical protein